MNLITNTWKFIGNFILWKETECFHDNTSDTNFLAKIDTLAHVANSVKYLLKINSYTTGNFTIDEKFILSIF